MNRSKVVIKNFTWELGYYFFVIALGFLAPRLIILTYGSEVNGLSSTITQILSVILLIQSGATTAAVFSLYKPIVEKDIVKINVIINATSRYFKILSYIYFILMFVMAIITSKTISSSIDRKLIFWAFFIMGSKGFLDLYFTSQFRVLFTAYEQKFYMLTGMLIEQIIYYMLMFG